MTLLADAAVTDAGVNILLLQYEKLGYTLGYANLDQIRDYLFDAIARVSRVCSRCFLFFHGKKKLQLSFVECKTIFVLSITQYDHDTQYVGRPQYNIICDFCCAN